jgi:hypothetical protein
MDSDRVRKILTDQAIGEFRKTEQARFLLARREAALAGLLTGGIDLARYYLETETIRTEFDAKRDEWQDRRRREATRR